RSADCRGGIQKGNPLMVPSAVVATLDASLHQLLSGLVERRQRTQSRKRFVGVDIGIFPLQIPADLQHPEPPLVKASSWCGQRMVVNWRPSLPLRGVKCVLLLCRYELVSLSQFRNRNKFIAT